MNIADYLDAVDRAVVVYANRLHAARGTYEAQLLSIHSDDNEAHAAAWETYRLQELAAFTEYCKAISSLNVEYSK